MRYLDEYPTVLEDKIEENGEAVTLIRTVYREDDEDAEPGPFELGLMRAVRVMKHTALGLVAFAAVAAYPAMTIHAHQLDASVPDIASVSAEWASPAIGLSSVLLERESDGQGWIRDHANWTPQARLTALPAWQTGMTTALGDFIRTRAELSETDGAPDRDLMMASRLLTVRDDGRMSARLTAASQALARYDGRLMQGLAVAPAGAQAALAQLDLIETWSVEGRASLRAAIVNPDGFLASTDAISAYYDLRGRAQVASILLAGLAVEDPALINAPEVSDRFRDAKTAWRAVAEASPLMLGNAKPGAIFPGNDLMAAAYLLDEARAATLALSVAIETIEAQPDAPEARILADYPSQKPQLVP